MFTGSIDITLGGTLTKEQDAAHAEEVMRLHNDALIARFGTDITDELAQAAGFRDRRHLACVCLRFQDR